MDGGTRQGWKEELGTGLDNQRFESPGSALNSSRANDSPMLTGLLDEKARYPGVRVAEIRDPTVCLPELASRQSVVGPIHEMCDPFSALSHEMYDPSSPPKISLASSKRKDSPELLHPINSESGRPSLWQKTHGTPAIDIRLSTAKRSSNGWPDTHETGSTISSVDQQASEAYDLCRIPSPGPRHTSMANPDPYTQSDSKRCTIFVSTDISRESSDSSGASLESPRVETIISSSPRHKPVDRIRPLPTPPQRKSSNLNRPLPSVPNSPLTTSSSERFSVVSRNPRLSSGTSVSYTDSEFVGCAPTDASTDTFWTAHDSIWESQRRHEPPLTSSSSTDSKVMRDEILAGDASSMNRTRPHEPRNPYTFWNTVSPSTLAHTATPPASNDVSPSSPKSGLSSPWSYLHSPISPTVNFVSSPSKVACSSTFTREGPDPGRVEHHKDATSGGISLDSSPSGSTTKDLEHTRSARNSSEPGRPIQRPVSHPAVSTASRAPWPKDILAQQHSHSFYRPFQIKEFDQSSVCVQPSLMRMESTDLAGPIHSSGVDDLLESMIKSNMTHAEASKSWTTAFLPSVSSSAHPARDIDMESSFMSGSMETVRPEIPVPLFTPIDTMAANDGLCKLPSPTCDGDPHYPFNSSFCPERQPSVALWSRRHMDVPPLPLSRSNIFSSGSRGEEVILNPRRSRPTPEMVPQSQSREGQRSNGEAAGSESKVASAHQRRPHLSNALDSPSSTKTLPHCFDHGSLLVTHSAPKQMQVETLQALVDAVNKDWMQTLESDPELWLRCAPLPPGDLFEKGIGTLREYFRGRLGQTFDDVFAFIHLAFAAAFLLHYQQDFYGLDTFYYDALQWQHALSDKDDKILFLKVMDRWSWLPKIQPTLLFNSSCHASVGSSISRESLICSNQADMLDVLRNSEVFKGCISFLDGKPTLIPFKI